MVHLLFRAALSGLTGGGSGAPKVQLDVDWQELQRSVDLSIRTMNEFLKQRDYDLVKIMRNEASIVAAKAALATPPLNGGGNKEAVDNIEKDVHYIFQPLENIPFAELVLARQWPAVTAYDFQFKSKRLQKAYEEGNWEVVHKAFAKGGMGDWSAYDGPDIKVVSNPNTNLHKMGRGKDGKLNGRQFHISGAKASAMDKIKNYAAEAAKAIGKMAGGWVACYIKLDGRGFNIPLDYASKGKGTVKTKWWGVDKFVEMKNEVGNFGGFINQRSAFFGFLIQEAGLRIRERHVENSRKLLERLKMT
jgi:hypothetical protein